MSDTHMNETVKQEVIHIEGDAKLPAGAHEIEFTGRQFGTLQGWDSEGHHVLNPQPSDSPDDPLNWSFWFKQYVVVLVCLAVLFSNMTGAGPTTAIIQQTITWEGLPVTSEKIGKVAYLFSSTALMNGVGLFFWVPAATKWGRRPVYITCLTFYLATLFWAGFAKSYGSELAARILLGAASGAGECLGALTVTDIFFAHERGTYMAYYNVFLSCGAAFGMIMDGAITQHLPSWRYIYYVDAALTGGLLILVIFTFPETAFDRSSLIMNGHIGTTLSGTGATEQPHVIPSKTYLQRMAFCSGTFTKEPYWRLFIRPWGLIFLPAVWYSTFVFGVTIGFLVAITQTTAPAYGGVFGFDTQQIGFLFFGGIVGSLLGIPAGGQLGDWLADRTARRSNGVREPEHRLPALIIPMVTAPLALVLYGLCIEKHTNWFVGCFGLALVNFSICAATNITLVYSIDAYKPVADEVVTATLGFKAIIGYVLSFYTTAWVDSQGYLAGFGQMAAISFGVIVFWIPMYYFGKKLRRSSAEWRVLKWATAWSDDRDDLKWD